MTVILAFRMNLLPRVENFAAYLIDAREMHLCQSLNLHNVHALDVRDI